MHTLPRWRMTGYPSIKYISNSLGNTPYQDGESLVTQASNAYQMHWASHFTKMEDVRLPKQLFYRELQHSRHPRHKLKKHFRDFIKNNPRALSINNGHQEQMKVNRSSWKNNESNSTVWDEYFESSWHLIGSEFVMSFVWSVCLKPNLLVIWNFMTANYGRLVLQRFFISKLQIITDSMTKYVCLQHISEIIWGCTRAI